MHRLGLKLWSTNFECYSAESVRLFQNGIFDYVELYVVPGSLCCLEQWKTMPYEFIIHAPHSAHGFNLADASLKKSNFLKYQEVKSFADELKASYIIFHGGVDGAIDETARQLANFDEPRALIENKPMRPLASVCDARECRGFLPAEIQLVMERSGCGFCLDVGHAVCSAVSRGIEPYDSIDEWLTHEPRMIHLSDTADMHSELDCHLNLGQGALDLVRVINGLPPLARITLETEKPSDGSLSGIVSDFRCFRECEWTIREVAEGDRESVFLLANDLEVRKNSFASASISWETHCLWFDRQLNSGDSVFLIAENAYGEFVGQIRLEALSVGGRQYRVGIALAARFRFRGWGAELLRRGIAVWRARHTDGELMAEIRPCNLASLQIFDRNDFVRIDEDVNRIVLAWKGDK